MSPKKLEAVTEAPAPAAEVTPATEAPVGNLTDQAAAADAKSSVRCPNCNAEFQKDNAPWLKQVDYCSRHDRVRLAGTDCEFCVEEAKREPASTQAPGGGSGDSASS